MAFQIPENTLSIALKLFGIVTEKMQEAQVAFSGQPGSGQKKKEMVKSAVLEGVELQNLIKADLMTPEQEAKLVDAADKGIDFIFATVEFAQMFKTPTV